MFTLRHFAGNTSVSAAYVVATGIGGREAGIFLLYAVYIGQPIYKLIQYRAMSCFR